MSRASRAFTVSAAVALLTVVSARAATDNPSARQEGAAATGKLQELTVTAERAKLASRVRKFLNQIVAPENDGEDGMARWQVPPVCPLVSGLTQQQGEFILERLTAIAGKAGVPLAGQHCRPNLYVLVTPQPEQLLRAMEKRNRPFTFGYETFGANGGANSTETPEGVVDTFIETPRAVRVWYDSNQKDPWGQPLGVCPGAQVLAHICAPGGGFVGGAQLPICNAGVYNFRCGRGVSAGSHLILTAVSTFSRVFVIVDRTRLHGVNLGQLAAYVAMVGLAKLKTGANLDDAPTILKLFDGAPGAAPAGLTDWDRAFLKSLYETEQLEVGQRGQIERAMVRHIVP